MDLVHVYLALKVALAAIFYAVAFVGGERASRPTTSPWDAVNNITPLDDEWS